MSSNEASTSATYQPPPSVVIEEALYAEDAADTEYGYIPVDSPHSKALAQKVLAALAEAGWTFKRAQTP